MTAAPETLSQAASVDSTTSKFSSVPNEPRKHTRSNLNMKQITRAPGHRLVEYFVVVSSLPSNDAQRKAQEAAASNLSNNVSYSSEFDDIPHNISVEDMEDLGENGSLNFEPIITARYPRRDHPSNPLHQSVACFCFPGGVIKLKSKPSMPKIHYFVMTGGRGTQLYGVCLTIHEPFSVKIRSGGSSDDPSSESEESPKTVEMFVPKCICILSAYPYLVAFREYLTQLDRLIRKGGMNVPIERYITNFCSEVPAPPPGSFQVQTTILDSIIKIWSPPHNQPIPYVSLPFSHLFECLDIPNIIYAWHALALERQILVVSTQLTLLTTCCEVLKSLLFPMSWQNAYIPLLPRFLCPILSAPMAFLIGIDKQFLSDAFQHLSPECIVIDLDTNQVQFGPSTPPMPKLPPGMAQSLSIQLHQNAGMIFREVRSLRKDDDFSDRGQHLLPHVKQMADACWESKLCLYDEAFHLAFTPEKSRNSDFLNGNDNSGMDEDFSGNGNSAQYIHRIHLAKNKKQSRWDAVQEAFLNVYVGLFCNYRSCLVFPSKEAQEQSNLDGGSSRGSSSGSVGHGAGFKSREFLKSQKHERRLFLNELIQTQMFDFFITKRLYGVSASDISFFDRAVDMYNKRQATVMGKIFTMDRSLHPSNTMTSPSGKVATNGGALHDGSHRPVSAPNSVRNLIGRGVEYVAGGATPVDELLLQSAKVHRKLKTIVPPEPYADGLGNGGEENPEDSIGYSYESFPSTFDKKLFSTPRPLPPAVLAEFDRQQDNLSSFRRSLKKHLDGQGKDESSDKSLSPEATTFTVFLVGFTAMIGKELIDLSQNEHMCEDERQILATYTVDSIDTEMEKSLASIEDGDGIDVDTFHIERGRFKEPLSASKIEEAKETALAQLTLAFEILDLMKERDLRTDPIAYKSMIDACGRCGDTERATELLTRMHEDGIVADGVVYSCLVSAFSVESKLANINLNNLDLPEWANGASAELDWNRLEGQSGSRYNNSSNNDEEDAAVVPPGTKARKIGKNISKFIKRRIKTEETKEEKKVNAAEMLGDAPIEERYVTEAIANQIGFGENLLELVYPDITIDTDDERCPKCDTMMIDDDVVAGWTPDPQDYTTRCRTCNHKFVPKFRVQSTSQTFIGSKGAGTPLICERLSPWVLEKELRTKMHDIEGAEDLIDPSWREEENKNAVLWWNLILSFMRYRLPFTYLLQGSFPQDLISPMPSMDYVADDGIEEVKRNEDEITNMP